MKLHAKFWGLAVLAVGFVSTAMAADRVGPVSQYGQLLAGKNSAKEGRIYGACKGVVDGYEVAVQGMSLFWANAPGDGGQAYWNRDIITELVNRQHIQIIRAPMAVEANWDGATHYFMNGYTETYQNQMDSVVAAAIANDIYVIIDFHSHCAENNTSGAQSFFSRMAQKWGAYDNVIFEIYNEPKNNCADTWFEIDGARNYWKEKIAPYAKAVIQTIREFSDNLIVVGTPYYDQYTNAALAEPLNDTNVAYTFHYYAGEDPYRHTTDNQGNNAVLAMKGGLSVFVTEWGNSAPSGNGGFDSTYSQVWYDWMKRYQLSGANWSVSNKDETASYFKGGAWNYSESGNWVNTHVFAALPTKYDECVVPESSSSSSEASSSDSESSSSVLSSSSAYTSCEECGSPVYSSGDESSSSVWSSCSAESSSSVASSSSEWGATNSSSSLYSEMSSSSSSVETVSSSSDAVEMNSSSSEVVEESSSSESPTLVKAPVVSVLQIAVAGRTLLVSGVDYANVDVFDMQGRPVASYSQVSGSVGLDALGQGSYIVRVRSGSFSVTKRAVIK